MYTTLILEYRLSASTYIASKLCLAENTFSSKKSRKDKWTYQ